MTAPNFTCHGYPWQGTLVPWLDDEPPDPDATHPLNGEGAEWDFIFVDAGDGPKWYGRCINGAGVALAASPPPGTEPQ